MWMERSDWDFPFLNQGVLYWFRWYSIPDFHFHSSKLERETRSELSWSEKNANHLTFKNALLAIDKTTPRRFVW